MTHPTTPLFTTARLRVRKLGPRDFDSLLRVYGDPDAMRYVDDGLPISALDCRRWIDVTLANYELRGYGMSAVELLASREVIGFCGLVHPGGQAEAELKYAYLREHWGHGHATEAAIGMLAHGERRLGIQRAIATTDPEHAASHRVLVKAGMRDAGLRTEANGERVRVFEWSATRPAAPG